MANISDELYTEAYALSKTSLARTLKEEQAFAVKQHDGALVLCSFTQKPFSFSVIMSEGFPRFFQAIINDTVGPFQALEMQMSQSLVRYSFAPQNNMLSECFDDACSWAKRQGVKLDDKSGYPQFLRHEVGYEPWPIRDPHDLTVLALSLRAAQFLSGLFDAGKSVSSLGFSARGVVDGDLLPLLEEQPNIGFSLSLMAVPSFQEKSYAPITLKRPISPVKHTDGSMIAEVVMALTMQSGDSALPPYLPLMMVMLDLESGYADLSGGYKVEEALSAIQKEFAEKIEKDGIAKKVLVRSGDSRTKAVLENLCAEYGVNVEECPDDDPSVQALLSWEQELYENIVHGNMSDAAQKEAEWREMCEKLESYGDDQLLMFPASYRDMLVKMAKEGAFSEKFTERLLRIILN